MRCRIVGPCSIWWKGRTLASTPDIHLAGLARSDAAVASTANAAPQATGGCWRERDYVLPDDVQNGWSPPCWRIAAPSPGGPRRPGRRQRRAHRCRDSPPDGGATRKEPCAKGTGLDAPIPIPTVPAARPYRPFFRALPSNAADRLAVDFRGAVWLLTVARMLGIGIVKNIHLLALPGIRWMLAVLLLHALVVGRRLRRLAAQPPRRGRDFAGSALQGGGPMRNLADRPCPRHSLEDPRPGALAEWYSAPSKGAGTTHLCAG